MALTAEILAACEERVAFYDAVLTRIVVDLEDIPGIGRVHDYEPYAASAEALREHFAVTIAGLQQLRAWTVTRPRLDDQRLTNEENAVVSTFIIRGYLGVNDGGQTEQDLHTLIEYIRVVLSNDYTLGGLVTLTEPVQVLDVDHRTLVNTLCHYAELHLTVRYRERLV